MNYIKVDNNKIINENQIRWVKKINECLEICTKSNGCSDLFSTHTLCKSKNKEDYLKLNTHFVSNDDKLTCEHHKTCHN